MVTMVDQLFVQVSAGIFFCLKYKKKKKKKEKEEEEEKKNLPSPISPFYQQEGRDETLEVHL